MHPELADFYDLSLFIDVQPGTQRGRILKRNTPDLAERHFYLWIPLEERYFAAFSTKNHCSEVIYAEDVEI